MYRLNHAVFKSFVVAENIIAEGTLPSSFMDIWEAMRKVFQKEDMSPIDREMHFNHLVPPIWENMGRVLGCENLCLVLDHLLQILANHTRPGRLDAALKVWGIRSQRWVMCISDLCYGVDN